ncbi:glycosyltransferase family 2 protein [Flagellimonas onchidii]|uniref:glycosyltransferase family 2 protein n=1 Tax=Flagellimonas onchidii TaxID=2562684 RepID=UPI0010A672BC|nr:glycosyltransferase family 2 protein [Allomuricauda onchidii]
MECLVSIIIPVFNESAHIGRCLSSIVKQDCKNVEIIVVDDYSTDNSLEIIKEFQKRNANIKVLRNIRNMGPGATRNKGINIAAGTFIWFVDSDDWIESNALSILKKCLNGPNNAERLFLFGFTEHFQDLQNNAITRNRIPCHKGILQNAFYHFLVMTNGVLNLPWIYIFPKKLIVGNGILFQEGTFYEDIFFSAKAIYYSKKIMIVPKTLYNYNFFVHNSITQTYSKKKILDMLGAYEDLYDFMKTNGLHEKYLNEFSIRFLLFGLASCLEIYSKLPLNVKEDKGLKEKLGIYLKSDNLNSESLFIISEFTSTINTCDEIIRDYYLKKLLVLEAQLKHQKFVKLNV